MRADLEYLRPGARKMLASSRQKTTMTEQHPITPTTEMLKRWEDDWFEEREHADVLLIQAFQAGADAELEACVEWGNDYRNGLGRQLRAARRPKPPSLKQQAFKALDCIEADFNTVGDRVATIRRALEQLSDD